MQWMMLQQAGARDYVIATGVQYTVREFVSLAGEFLDIPLQWQGSGEDEAARDNNGNVLVAVDQRYFRPAEVTTLLGDSSRAHYELGWKPKIDFRMLVQEMVREDLKAAQREGPVRKHGLPSFDEHEV